MQGNRRDPAVSAVVDRIRGKTCQWGITVSYLAGRLGVSRQYAWQIINDRTPLSEQRALQIEAAVDLIIAKRSHLNTVGERLRAARVAAGLTLKQVA